LPWLLVVLGPLLLLGPALAAGEVLYWGTTVLQFVPWHTYAVQAARAGEVPLWNPLVGMGAPLLANYQSGLLYPPNWAMLLVEPAIAQTWLTMLHWMVAGAGMVLLCRRLGIGAVGQGVAGLGFALSGYLVARSSFQSINNSVAWLPWIVWAGEGLVNRIVDAQGRTAVGRAVLVLVGMLTVQWLAGHAQTAWYSLCLVLAWVAWRAWGTRRSQPASQILGALGLCLVLAFCLAAAQLLPTLEYLGNSQRAAAVDPEAGLTYSLWPWRLLGWVAPGLFGHPAFDRFWGYANYWEDALYVGTLAFVLALMESVQALRGKSRTSGRSRLLIGIVLVSLLLALGKNTPVYPWLFRTVPTFDMFQAPSRWSLLAVFAVCLLAASGAEQWHAPQGRALYWTRLGTAGAAGMIAFALLATRLLPGLEPSFVRSFALCGLSLAISGVLTLTYRPRPSPIWLTALGLFLLLDLLLSTVGLNPTTPASSYRGRSQLAALGADHRLYMPSDLEEQLKFERFFRFDRYDPEFQMQAVRMSGLPNVTMLDALRSANNFDPLLPARYTAWISRLESSDASMRLRLMSLMDVAWIASEGENGQLPVYRPITGAQRVRLVAQAVAVCSMQEALERVFSEDFDAEALAVIETADCHREMPGGGPGAVEITGQRGNAIEVTARAEQGGWVVVSDLYDPGWRAWIGEEAVEVFPADGAFRAVYVPPGTHRVSFKYRPGWLLWGPALSIGALLTLLVLGWLWRKR
jgi:hypothetical protein